MLIVIILLPIEAATFGRCTSIAVLLYVFLPASLPAWLLEAVSELIAGQVKFCQLDTIELFTDHCYWRGRTTRLRRSTKTRAEQKGKRTSIVQTATHPWINLLKSNDFPSSDLYVHLPMSDVSPRHTARKAAARTAARITPFIVRSSRSNTCPRRWWCDHMISSTLQPTLTGNWCVHVPEVVYYVTNSKRNVTGHQKEAIYDVAFFAGLYINHKIYRFYNNN